MRRVLNIGTRSILFGSHQFAIHPCFVALAWWRLYGFPADWRLWLAFLVHDLGYWGKPNMDGPEGEEHPRLGASIVYALTGSHQWWEFTAYHSRFWARRNKARISRLAKFAIVITPCWLWLFLARLSGELYEYLDRSEDKCRFNNLPDGRVDVKRWHLAVVDYLRAWVAAHRNGSPDTWTPEVDNGKRP